MSEPRGALDVGTLDQLRDSVGGDTDFLAELIDEFLDDAPTQLEALRVAATSGDATVALRAAHTLKGTSRTFGAVDLASLCQEAESAAGAEDLPAVRSVIDGIEAEWARVRAELIAYGDGRA